MSNSTKGLIIANIVVLLLVVFVSAFAAIKPTLVERVGKLEQQVFGTGGDGELGGVSNFGIVAADYQKIGATSSTTSAIYEFTIGGTVSGAENQDSWRNEVTLGSVFVKDITLFWDGTATSTFTLYVGTSTAPFNSDAFELKDTLQLVNGRAMIHWRTNTSTIGITGGGVNDTVGSLTSSSTANWQIKEDGYLNVLLSPQDVSCTSGTANTTGNRGKCEAASSTNTGVKPIYWTANVWATSTKASIQ